METVVMSALIAVIASVATTKILATHYFKIVDGYVKDMCQQTEKFIQVMERKLRESVNP